MNMESVVFGNGTTNVTFISICRSPIRIRDRQGLI